MSTRSFAVFQDTPSEESKQKSSATVAENPLSPRTSSQENMRSTETILSPTMEKENLDPVTGLAVQPSTTGKKRKMSESSSILATKAISIPASSSSKASKGRELKRKSSTTSASGKKGKNGLSKKGSEGRVVLGCTENGSSSHVAAGSRRPSRALSRQPTTILGSVPEEAHEEADDISTVEQALINSRCYDLTVKPLADVSDAYLQSSEKPEVKDEDEDLLEIRMVKEVSTLIFIPRIAH